MVILAVRDSNGNVYNINNIPRDIQAIRNLHTIRLYCFECDGECGFWNESKNGAKAYFRHRRDDLNCKADRNDYTLELPDVWSENASDFNKLWFRSWEHTLQWCPDTKKCYSFKSSKAKVLVYDEYRSSTPRNSTIREVYILNGIHRRSEFYKTSDGKYWFSFGIKCEDIPSIIRTNGYVIIDTGNKELFLVTTTEELPKGCEQPPSSRKAYSCEPILIQEVIRQFLPNDYNVVS